MVPVWGCDPAAPYLPIGVQVIAAPWRERDAFRVAAALVVTLGQVVMQMARALEAVPVAAVRA